MSRFLVWLDLDSVRGPTPKAKKEKKLTLKDQVILLIQKELEKNDVTPGLSDVTVTCLSVGTKRFLDEINIDGVQYLGAKNFSSQEEAISYVTGQIDLSLSEDEHALFAMVTRNATTWADIGVDYLSFF